MADETGRVELRDKRDVERFLAGKPREWAEILAARAALRVVPLLAPILGPEAADLHRSIRLAVMLRLLRSSAMPCLAAIAINHGKELVAAASAAQTSAADAAFAVADVVAANSEFAALAILASEGAANAAGFAISTIISASTAKSATDAIIAGHNAARSAAPTFTAITFPAISDDATSLHDGGPLVVARASLWPDGHVPEFLATAWTRFTTAFAELDGAADWRTVWIDWYEAVRDGRAPWGLPRPASERILVEAMLWPQEEWDGDPAAINRRIAGLIEAERTRLVPTPAIAPVEDAAAEAATVAQRPAAHVYDERDGMIVARPLPPEAIDSPTAATLQAELLGKARSLRLRLAQNGSEQRPIGSLDRLIAELDVAPDALNVGLLLSRSRSIEADRVAYDSAEGRALLFPGAIAEMVDVAESTADLLALFPVTRRIEAARVALELGRQPERIAAVRESLDAIRDTAKDAPFVDASAQESLASFDAALAEERDLAVVADVLADRVLDTANFVRRVASRVGEASTPLAVETLQLARKAAGELGRFGSASWEAVKSGFPKGLGKGSEWLGQILPFIMLAAISKELAVCRFRRSRPSFPR